MARKLRVQYPGAIYHVMNCADHLEVIFRDGQDPELFLRMVSVQGSKFAGPEWKESSQRKAQRILAEELAQRRWTPQDLQQPRKGDPEKLEITRRLRAETTVTYKWIAQYLSIGAPRNLSNCLSNRS